MWGNLAVLAKFLSRYDQVSVAAAFMYIFLCMLDGILIDVVTATGALMF